MSRRRPRPRRRLNLPLHPPLHPPLLLQLLFLLPLVLPLLPIPLLPVRAELSPQFRATDDFAERVLITDLEKTTDLDFAPDGSDLLLIAQQDGTIWGVTGLAHPDARPGAGAGEGGESYFEVEDRVVDRWEALDLSGRMCHNGSRGLMSVAFHPSYPAPEGMWAYVFYTPVETGSGDCYTGKWDLSNVMGTTNRLSRFPIVTERGRMTLDDASEQVLLETPVQMSHLHNGGDIAFGNDGMLYLTIGNGLTNKLKNEDGMHYELALDNLFGKVVRLTPEGTIPNDNPYTPSNGYTDSVFCGGNRGGYSGDPSVPCGEIYAVGLRNPFRFAFDPNTSQDTVRFWINDVGGSTFERTLEGREGANYGYPVVQGPCPNDFKRGATCKYPEEFDQSVHWERHDAERGGCVTGGAFVPVDIGWPADFTGSYLFGEYKLGGIYRISPGGTGCPYPQCEVPTSDYEPSKTLLSDATALVSMQFGPYLGSTPGALYYLTRGSGRGSTEKGRPEGLVRIAYRGTPGTAADGQQTGSSGIPLAVLDADVTIGFNPLSVRFDGTRSTDSNGKGGTLAFEWDFDGDGTADSTSPADTFVYNTPGVYEASLTVTDGGGATDMISVTITVDNAPPAPVIESPSGDDVRFAVGDTIRLVGSATDSEDGALPASSMTWEIREVHGDHYHTVDKRAGRRRPRFVMPGPLEHESVESIYLEAVLTATDSRGLSSTAVRTLRPNIVPVNLDSSPPGLYVLVSGSQVVKTPRTVLAWENQELEVEAVGDATGSYRFAAWSDGGERMHSITADPSGHSDVVAFFDPVKGPATSVEATADDEDEKEAGPSIFKLQDFSVTINFISEPDRRRWLGENETPHIVSYLSSDLKDIVSEELRKELKTLAKSSGLPFSKPASVVLSHKSEKVYEDGERYKAVFQGIVTFKKTEEDEMLPTASLFQSMQEQALARIGDNVADVIEGSVQDVRVSSVITDVVHHEEEPQEDITKSEGSSNGNDTNVNIVRVCSIVAIGAVALTAIAMTFLVVRARRMPKKGVEMDADRSLETDDDSLPNTPPGFKGSSKAGQSPFPYDVDFEKSLETYDGTPHCCKKGGRSELKVLSEKAFVPSKEDNVEESLPVPGGTVVQLGAASAAAARAERMAS